ncbi:MAG TPA: stage V sporulation protein AB [Clostridiales bacterium]|nr:stage V sporulation protein AB [Clostridiales bacterium]
MIKAVITIVTGVSGGLAVGASVTAFFTVIGVTVKIIEWSRKKEYTLLYQCSIVLGALVSCFIYFSGLTLKHLQIIIIPLGFMMGIFVGMLAAALTETLDIITVAAKKLNIVRWIYLIVVVTLLGKVVGSLLFFLIPGFF